MLITNLALIFAGLAGLYFGGGWLVTGASRVATAFRISPLIIGLTIVAVGTSAPELVVSVIAAVQGSEGLALGNVVGSNIANIGFILGLTGTFTAVQVQETLVKREIPLMIGVTLFATVLILDGVLSRVDGLLLLGGFIIFNGIFYYLAVNNPEERERAVADVGEDEVAGDPSKFNLWLEAGRILGGSLTLVIGAQLMVTGATDLARALGISELIIGVTVVAFGTSLPELAASLNAAMRGENDIAVGNIIGSNIANLLLVLGATAAVADINIGTDAQLNIVEYGMMILFSFMLWPFARNRVLDRRESLLFLLLYLGFVGFVLLSALGVV